MKRTVIPQLILEKYLLDEADDNERALVEQAVKEDPETASQLDDLRRSNEEILTSYAPPFMARRIEGALEKEKKKKPSLFTLPVFKAAFALSLAAVIVVAFLISPGSESFFRQPEVIYTKGEAALKVYKENGEEPVLLKNNESIAHFDTVQLSYNAGDYSFGTIISIDGRGAVTLHYPDSNIGSLKLRTGGEILLEYSYELDDAPDFERFFFILSKEEFSLSKIMARARVLAEDHERAGTGKLSLPRNFKQISILLKKEN